jgi:asparagine synthase (glutamine-hydrolysing)
MCGISGFVTNKTIGSDVLNRMVNSLSHRGPDEEKYYKDDRFNGGHRRLSINDLSGGGQPLTNESNSLILFFNGEIYNYPKLKKQLESEYIFQTGSDGEVICHLYDKFGEDAFGYLEGAFSISLWDKQNKRLYLVRDYVGEKPLYYSKLSENEIVYSSELKSFKEFPLLKLELNKQAVWDYLTFLWVPEPDTIYNEVFALEPGYFLSIDGSGIKKKEFIKLKKDVKDRSYDEVVVKTRDIVIDSIKSRLMSDVQIGCFLSGGVDSSIISCIASNEVPNLKTYTIGFENGNDPYGGDNDESVFAEDYAKKIKTNHKTIKVTSDDFKNVLEEFIYYADQPFGVSSGLGIFLITKEARKDGVKVLLSGDGADEMFGGYSWYQYLDDINYHDKNSDSALETDITFHNSYKKLREKLTTLQQYSSHKRAWGWHYYASEHDKNIIFSKQIKSNVSTSLRFFKKYNKNTEWSSIDFIEQDREFYLPNEMLKKADRMGMANSIEVRVPFVSKKVIEFTNSLSIKELLYKGILKSPLKDAFKTELTEEIINRPKHGFNVPIDLWLKEEWKDLVEATFSENSNLRKHSIISSEFTLRIVEEMLKDDEIMHGHTIFSLITLNIWLENEFND